MSDAWVTGNRWFSETPDGPIYQIELTRSWRGRYQRARVSTERGVIVGEVKKRSQLVDGAEIPMPGGATVFVRLGMSYGSDTVEMSVDDREPIWRLAPPADIALVASLVRRESLVSFAVVLFLAFSSLGMIAAAISAANVHSLWAGPTGAFGLWATWRIARVAVDLFKGRGSTVVRALEADPSPIGWIHGSVQEKKTSIVVHYLNGEKRDFSVPRAHYHAVYALFVLRAPNAATGYTSEAEAQYEAMRKQQAGAAAK